MSPEEFKNRQIAFWQSLSIEEKTDRARKWKSSLNCMGEAELLAWVVSLGLDAYSRTIDGKTIGVFVPSKNIGLSFNPLYISSEAAGTPRKTQLDKTQFFKSHGIRIIHIFEHIWRDHQDQVKSYIRSALGANANRIGARKCELREVDKKTAAAFLAKTHIQASSQSTKLALGLYYNNELLALATFGVHHRDRNKWVLNRFAGATNWTVSGGLSRLAKEGARRLGDIITWADLSLSDAVGYLNSGWVLEESLPDDYFYTDFENVTSKQSRKKGSVHTPEGMTEHQHAVSSGWYRIYDCGKLRLRFRNPLTP